MRIEFENLENLAGNKMIKKKYPASSELTFKQKLGRQNRYRASNDDKYFGEKQNRVEGLQSILGVDGGVVAVLIWLQGSRWQDGLAGWED